MPSVIDSPYDYVPRLNFRAGEGCQTSEDCSEGDICIEDKCHQKCKVDGDCPSFQHCRADLYDDQEKSICGPLRESTVPDLMATIKARAAAAKAKDISEEEKDTEGLSKWGALGLAALIVGGFYFVASGTPMKARMRNRLRR